MSFKTAILFGAAALCCVPFLAKAVITGSYNFSRSAQFNAENILFIEIAQLAETYSSYIDHLKSKYAK